MWLILEELWQQEVLLLVATGTLTQAGWNGVRLLMTVLVAVYVMNNRFV
jgi:hypothetical protein